MPASKFDPFEHRMMSAGEFPYTIPRDYYTAKDEKAIKKAAVPDRQRIHKVAKGEKSAVLAYYEKRCHDGQQEAYRERINYLHPLTQPMASAKGILDSPRPQILDYPDGEPPESGPLRLKWFNQKRMADESRAQAHQYDTEQRQAKIQIIQIQATLAVIEYLYDLARAQWSAFFNELTHKHMDYVIGRSNNPVLIAYKTTASDWELPPVSERLVLTAEDDNNPTIKELEAGTPGSEPALESDPNQPSDTTKE